MVRADREQRADGERGKTRRIGQAGVAWVYAEVGPGGTVSGEPGGNDGAFFVGSFAGAG